MKAEYERLNLHLYFMVITSRRTVYLRKVNQQIYSETERRRRDGLKEEYAEVCGDCNCASHSEGERRKALSRGRTDRKRDQ